MSVAICATIRASEIDCLTWIEYHHRIGIDKTYLYYDCDDDSTYGIVEAFGGDRLRIQRCDESHWKQIGLTSTDPIEDRQAGNATHALNTARADGIEWLLHLDGDELLYNFAHRAVDEFFSTVPNEVLAVRFPVMEAVPDLANARSTKLAATEFKTHGVLMPLRSEELDYLQMMQINREQRVFRWKMLIVSLLLVNPRFRQSYYRGHTIGKSAVRTCAELDRITCHYPSPRDGRIKTMVAQGANILHYNCCSYETWIKKWASRVQGTAFARSLNAIQAQELKLFSQAYRSGRGEVDLRKLYKTLYTLDGWTKWLLREFSLIKTVEFADGIMPTGIASELESHLISYRNGA